MFRIFIHVHTCSQCSYELGHIVGFWSERTRLFTMFMMIAICIVICLKLLSLATFVYYGSEKEGSNCIMIDLKSNNKINLYINNRFLLLRIIGNNSEFI